jgi:hypothetical protein
MKNIKQAIISGLFFALFMGIFWTFKYDIKFGLIGGGLSGIFFGLFIYLFTVSKKVNKQMQVEITEKDTLIYSDAVNHFLKKESVGGKLYLFTDRLQFQSHKFNIQNHGHSIGLTKIEKVSFFNILGLIPTGLAITTTEKEVEKYVVNDRKIWKTEIEKLL